MPNGNELEDFMRHVRRNRKWIFLGLASVFLASACNVVLGLDEYTQNGNENVCMPGTQLSCGYSGPAGTENVGACKAGVKVCKMDGSGYDECSGEVIPAAKEDCGTVADDDCNGQTNESCPCEPGKMQPCYSGPAGTKDVGTCIGGMQTCNPDGLGYGPCNGEQPPRAEDCAQTGDENCDGYQCGETMWALKLDGISIEGVSVAGTGEIYVTGSLNSSFVLDNVNLNTAGAKDVVILKFDAAGKIVWGKSFGSSMADSAFAIDTDKNGNAYVTGYLGAAGTINGNNIAAGVFVVKVAPDGSFAWTKACGGSTSAPISIGKSISVADDGEIIYVAGSFGGSFSCSIGMSVTAMGSSDVFVVRLSGTNGGPVWTKGFGDPAYQDANAITIDGNGDAIVAGRFAGIMDLGGVTLTAMNSNDVFIAKFAGAGGTHIWSTSGAAGGSNGITVDAANNPVLLGGYSSTFSLGGMQLQPAAGAADLFLGKFGAADGKAIWLQGYGGINADTGQSVASGPNGRLVMGGSFRNSADFGGGPLTSANLDAAYVAVYDDMHTHQWSKQFSGQDLAANSTDSVAVGPNSEIVVGGHFGGAVDFGTGPLTAVAGGSEFLIRFAP